MDFKFPLYKLSVVAMAKLYEALGTEEILQLAQGSRKMRDRLSSVKHVQKDLEVHVEFGTFERKVTIFRNNEWFTMASHSIRHRDNVNFTQFQNLVINGVQEKVHVTDIGWATVNVDYSNIVFHFLEELESLFNIRIYLVYCTFRRGFPFQQIFTKSNLLLDADEITIAHCGVSHLEMTYLLDTLQVTIFEFQGNPGMHYEYPFALRFEIISIHDCSWLKHHNIPKFSDYKRLNLQCSFFTKEQLNAYVLEWFGSDKTLLQYVHLTKHAHNEPDEDWELEKILEGLPFVEGRAKKLDAAVHYDNETPYENGYDLVRKDGVTATFVVWEDEDQCRFNMTVWQKKDINVEHTD